MSRILSLFLIIVLAFNYTDAQTTIYSQSSNGSTDWNDASIWNDIDDGSGNFLNASGNDLVIQSGHTITINSDQAINSITVESGGTLTFDGTARTVSVVKLTVNNGGEFRAQTSGQASHTLLVSGDVINNGSFDLMPTSTRTCKLVFNKNGNQSITGTDTLNLFLIELNMGNSNANILDVQSVITLPVNSIELINGTFSLSSPSVITPFSNDTIKSTCGFILNNSNAICNEGTQGGLIVMGLLQINNGLFKVGALASRKLEIRGSASELNMIDGILEVSGRIQLTSSANINISGGEIKLQTAGNGTSQNEETFSIPQGSKITMSGGTVNLLHGGPGIDISITTSITNSTITGGTFILGDGTSSRKFEIDVDENLYNLIINSEDSLVELKQNLQLTGNLDLTSGIISLGGFNLTLSETSSITGTPSASSMIAATDSGKIIKEFSSGGSFTFPVGDIDGTIEYSPVTLNFLSGTFNNASVGVNVKNAKHPEVAFDASSYLDRYWRITSSGISSFNCEAIFNYTDNDINGSEDNIYLGQWDTTWNILNIADNSNNLLIDSLSSFSEFTGAEQESYPVELIFFSANKFDDGVTLLWKTINEINNYGFEVERLKILMNDDLIKSEEIKLQKWEKIGFIMGAGNTNSIIEYFFKDNYVLNGNKYIYRLKQIDYDGKYEYSNEVEVDINFIIKDFELFQNYPNPFNPLTIIKFRIPPSEEKLQNVTLKIFDVLGKEVATLINEEKPAGEYEVIFNANNLSSGFYFYTLEAGEKTLVKKMCLIK